MITEIIVQNTDKVFMRMSDPETAKRCADELVGATFNPRAVKEVFERFSNQGDDWFLESRPFYFSHQEQRELFVKWLMNLQPGEAFSKIDGTVRFLRVPLFRPTMSNEELERWRTNQPWLSRVNETNRSSQSSTGRPSSSDSSSGSRSSHPTRRRIDYLFD